MHAHLAVLSTDLHPGWPDARPGGLINKTYRSGQQLSVWIVVGWVESSALTGSLRPTVNQWPSLLWPHTVRKKVGPPDGAPECLYSIACGCYISLCKLVFPAEACLLLLVWTLGPETERCPKSASTRPRFLLCCCKNLLALSLFLSFPHLNPWSSSRMLNWLKIIFQFNEFATSRPCSETCETAWLVHTQRTRTCNKSTWLMSLWVIQYSVNHYSHREQCLCSRWPAIGLASAIVRAVSWLQWCVFLCAFKCSADKDWRGRRSHDCGPHFLSDVTAGDSCPVEFWESSRSRFNQELATCFQTKSETVADNLLKVVLKSLKINFLSHNSQADDEVTVRVGRATVVLGRLQHWLWSNRKICVRTNIAEYRTVLFPILHCRSENWTNNYHNWTRYTSLLFWSSSGLMGQLFWVAFDQRDEHKTFCALSS